MLRLRRGEEGAVAVIVVLSLVALLGVTVLTVDVGQLLFKRRAMVNASDAAALAAAQSCAGVDDSDSPEAMADLFAVDNVSVASGQITELVGCDGPPFGHVTVQYGMSQDLFFAGVLGFNGPAPSDHRSDGRLGSGPRRQPRSDRRLHRSAIRATATSMRTSAGGIPCYLWYDNDLFSNSAFGFLNLCTAGDPCSQGWDVDRAAGCPNVGSSLRDDWIMGNWSGGPNQINWPDETFVCRVSGLSTSNWNTLESRVDDTPPATS